MSQLDSEPDPEPEAGIQATADLSPVSPSPVHTAAPQVVPALQDTVDTIDAMVAAVVERNEAGDLVEDKPAALATSNVDNVDDDDDSFNDAYDTAAPEPQPVTEAEDDNDDYAKMFDSPVETNDVDESNINNNNLQTELDSLPPQTSSSVAQPADVVEPIVQTDAQAQTTVAKPANPATSATTVPADKSQPDSSSNQSPAQANQENVTAQDASLDIDQLVADLTSKTQDPSPSSDTAGLISQSEAGIGSATSPSSISALPSPSSLPPRPPLPHSASQSVPSQHHPVAASHSSTEGIGYSNSNTVGPISHSSTQPGHDTDYQRMWDQFMTDERQYMSEAKWDRFPEGSRLFIGNLSSDKVSKRDVFDIFRHYGRLAQISLKSAYGFVQYHTIEEGRRAIDALQDSEVKGRRIHLEISRLQEKTKKERNKSPDRSRGRDGRRGDKHNDYRSSRNASPRRGNYHGRDDDYSRGSYGRGRSRSPGYGRSDKDSYRRRSPSPYGRSRSEPELDLPRRYGADVPDIQVIMQQEVNRDFVAWVEHAFKEKGLRTAVMFLHPRFPKDSVIQRQAVEGVHAVVELDMRAQNLGKIPCQVFDRSAGSNNVRFDQYVDLDPSTAAEVVLRTRASASTASTAAYSQTYPPAGSYHPPYGAPVPQPVPQPAYQQPTYPAQPVNNAAADIANLISKVDGATLQQLITTIQAAPQMAAAPLAHNGIPHASSPSAGVQQADLQAILGALNGNGAQASQPSYGAAYGASAPATGEGVSAAQVQSIMSQLARYRQ